MGLCFSSCSSCKKNAASEVSVDTTVVDTANLVVENVISTNRQYMYTTYDDTYRWFETCVVLKDFLDDENCDGTVTGVSNVFQVVEEFEKGADTYVILCSTTVDTTAVDVKHGFWIEDHPLNEEAIKVTFAQAFKNIMKTNSPKPHSRQCVLRKEVGPVDANPQYIFGNSHAQLYVDAVTGEVSDKNPCYPENKGFKMPLGEWP